MDQMTGVLTFAMVAGAVVPWLVALLTRPGQSSSAKRWVSVGVGLAVGLLVVLGVGMAYGWPGFPEAAMAVMTTVGVMQVVYTMFKNHGISWIELKSSGEETTLPIAPD